MTGALSQQFQVAQLVLLNVTMAGLQTDQIFTFANAVHLSAKYARITAKLGTLTSVLSVLLHTLSCTRQSLSVWRTVAQPTTKWTQRTVIDVLSPATIAQEISSTAQCAWILRQRRLSSPRWWARMTMAVTW